MDIVHASKGDKFVTRVSAPVGLDALPDGTDGRGVSFLQLIPLVFQMLGASASMEFKARIRRVRTKFVIGDTLVNNEVGKVIYVDFLPKALASGQYVAAPNPHVVGKGLDCIQAAFDVQKKGVSAQKVVVSL